MSADNKNSLMALGSAAVLGIYAAGWFKTQAAAERFAHEAVARRPPAPGPSEEPRVQAVERFAQPTPAGTPARLRAGASAAVPSLPSLRRSADTAIVARQPLLAPTQVAPALAPATPQPTGSVEVASVPVVAQPSIETVLPPAPVPTPAPVPAPTVAPAPAPAKHAEPAAHQPEVIAAKFKDGTYYGWGTSRHGDIQAAVIIQGGRIANALIAQCLTRYSCSWIAALPPQVVGRQSAEVDYVSGATQSVNAFYYAVLEALSRAK